jgi:hypothetical protein
MNQSVSTLGFEWLFLPLVDENEIVKVEVKKATVCFEGSGSVTVCR